jgi:hypothetical protein
MGITMFQLPDSEVFQRNNPYHPMLDEFFAVGPEGKSIMTCNSHKGRTSREREKNRKRIARRSARDNK